MDASWRPSLWIGRSGPSTVVGERRPEKQFSCDDSKEPLASEPSTWHAAGVVRTGRTWGPKATQRAAGHPSADRTRQEPQTRTTVYGRDQMLLMRHLCMARGVGEAASGTNTSSCIKTQEMKALRSSEESQESPPESTCSTADTLSDIWDDHDTASETSAAGRTSIKLRANAPEFVPACQSPGPAIATPDLCPSGRSEPYIAVHDEVAPDNLQVASIRCREWQLYCGIGGRTEHTCHPIGFRHTSALELCLADVFAVSKPGELFVYA